jgi:polyisoprenoid-binding protein YceI
MDTCRVLTFREGLLSPVGHDLTLRVQRFSVEVAADGASLEARFDAGSLMVEAPASLSAHDRASIEENIRREVLEVRRHPEIRFRAKVSRDGDRAQLDGTLALKGVERPLRIASERVGEMWRARVTLHQQDFGIKPYTAMLGALRVRADVIVEIEVRA